MNAPTVKFIAADMDGTLLNEHQQLPQDFFALHGQLAAQDILFAAASGRQYYSLLDTFAPVHEQMVFIAENGATVMYRGKELYSCPLAREYSSAIIEAARTIEGAHIVLCGKRSAYVETKDKQALEEITKYYHRCQQVEDLLSVHDDLNKIAICHFDGTQEHVFPLMEKLFSAQNQVVVSAQIWLDIMDINASKGAAINHLQQTLGFSFEQTMSFGDYLNDIEMLDASYHAYAMENAHEKVKSHARFIAPANHQEGVLQVIREKVLGTS